MNKLWDQVCIAKQVGDVIAPLTLYAHPVYCLGVAIGVETGVAVRTDEPEYPLVGEVGDLPVSPVLGPSVGTAGAGGTARTWPVLLR
jgi:hypothetical protein